MSAKDPRFQYKAFHEACRLGKRAFPLITAERLLDEVNIIADTGFVVAFLNGRDIHHSWAVEIASQIDPPAITCESVLAEACFHLRSTPSVLSTVHAGLVKVDFDLERNLSRVATLARRYADRAPDLADLCLICLSERFRTYRVATVDSDFRIYRRFQREVIPTLMPVR